MAVLRVNLVKLLDYFRIPAVKDPKLNIAWYVRSDDSSGRILAKASFYPDKISKMLPKAKWVVQAKIASNSQELSQARRIFVM